MGTQNNLTRTPNGPGCCAWCGQKRARLYRYGGHRHAFCNLDCAMPYHDFTRNDYDYVEVPHA